MWRSLSCDKVGIRLLGVPVSFDQFAVVELSVHKFEEDNALLGDGVKPFVNGMSYCM